MIVSPVLLKGLCVTTLEQPLHAHWYCTSNSLTLCMLRVQLVAKIFLHLSTSFWEARLFCKVASALQREMLMKKQEEERWRDIPEWKRSLIVEKEKKKLEELVCSLLLGQDDDDVVYRNCDDRDGGVMMFRMVMVVVDLEVVVERMVVEMVVAVV